MTANDRGAQFALRIDPPHLHQKKASAKTGVFVRYFTHSTVLPMFEKKTTQKENEVRKHGGTVS